LSSLTYAFRGDGPSAVKRAEYSLQLSPFDPFRTVLATTVTFAHYSNGSYEQAIDWGRRTLAMDPNLPTNIAFLIASQVALGRVEEAREIAPRILAVAPRFSVERFASRFPFVDGARQGRLRDELLAAGLPP